MTKAWGSPETTDLTKLKLSAISIRVVGAWLLILFCAVANGALRETVLLPRIGTPWALIVSGLLLSACVAVVAWLLVARLARLASWQYLLLGTFWLVLTLVFEFTFGRIVQAKPWPELFAAYYLDNGNLWPAVLAVVLFSPLVAAHLQHRN